jgi:hypothetical protein
LFANYLAIGLFMVNELHKGIDEVAKYYSDWNLKCNLKKKGY